MSVRVAVRVRPFNSRETKLGCKCVVEMQDPSTRLKAHEGEDERNFTFDYSFWSFDGFQEDESGYLQPTGSKYADQKQVFERIGKSILDNAWQGYHCCLFAYGQTGSGKSYSMIGYGNNKGIVPITCNEIFERIKNKTQDIEYQVHASMLEIYNEEIQDLTIPVGSRNKGGLKIRQNKLLGTYVEGVKKHFVSSFAEIEAVMEEGTKNRTVASTQMNATSSRAHTIITIEFKQTQKVGNNKASKISMINLVDLAGSERQDKTGATGQRLKEAVGINQSLTTLGQVISVLAENSEGANKFVPYRNSALTRILQNALGGNSQTIMICAISPANDNYDETLSTLRYADRAKKIKNKPIVNESESDKMIRQLKEENDRLKKMLEGKGMDPNQMKQSKGMGKEEQEKFRQREEELKRREQEMMEREKSQETRLKELEEELKRKEEERLLLLQQQEEEKKILEDKFKELEDNENKEEEEKKMQEESDEKQKKLLDQQETLLKQQQEQQKMLEEQKEMLKKSQEDYQMFMDEMKRLREEREQDDDGDDDWMDEDDEEERKKSINANIRALEDIMRDLHKTRDEKKKEIAEDMKKFHSHGELDNILNDGALKELEKEMQRKKQKMPPYFENISKDVMINRKMKLILQKNLLTVGKDNQNPPNDIIFGGRDIHPRHATIHIIEGKVFLKPLHKQCHLYVNGQIVTDSKELMNLDRVVFGWNSAYLFKNKDDNRTDEKISDRKITWDFVKDELAHLVDIDQSDTEDQGGCCQIF